MTNRWIFLAFVWLLAGCDSATDSGGDGSGPGGPPPEPPTFAQVSAGAHHTCGLHQDGRVFCWGRSLHGALGQDSLWVSLHAVQVPISAPVVSLSSGYDHVCAVTGQGHVVCWGAGGEGALGNGGFADRFTPTQIVTSTETPRRFFVEVAAGGRHTCALNLFEDGVALGSTPGATLPNLHCWGRGTEGQLGAGGIATRAAPTPLNRPLNVRAVGLGQRHSCAIESDGVLNCWGWNFFGQLGFGVFWGFDSPNRIVSDERFRAVALGDEYTCALTEAGEAWCWGRGDSGQLGNGSQTSHNLPQRVAGGHRFQSISASIEHTCAVDHDGRAWCWGNNRLGRLGTSEGPGVYPEPRPVADPGPAGGSAGGASGASSLRFRTVSAGFLHTCGVAMDGRGYCWGYGAFGQLGTGTTFDFDTPTLLYLEGRIAP